MALAPGSRFGSYEVLAKIGEGGMGEVYRARDLTLGRDVALKALPESFANDPDRVRRFEREAKTLASLNHPNIAQIYGVEPVGADGRALVMELVPGLTLDAAIQKNVDIRGSNVELLLDWSVPIAIQIAEALEAAHDAGIIHRDLKPANIKLRDDGVVKVLDFGLARATDPSGAGTDAGTHSSPTMLSPATTQRGVILGTAGYMSPEQAKGRAVDKRADIWAFGVVVYEMLTGRRLFEAETLAEIIAAVIKDAPDLSALPAGTPRALREVIARCLEPNPKQRLRDIGEARIALQKLGDPEAMAGDARASSLAADASSPWRGRLVAGTGAVVLAAAAAFVVWWARPTQDVPVRRFDLPADMADTRYVAISPDGSRVASLAEGRLLVRELATGETKDLGAVPPASEGLFFSPDGQRIAYSGESFLRVVPIAGGTTFSVCKVPASGRVLDGIWLDDGTIYFVVWRDSAYKVAANGGTPELAFAIDPNTEIDFHSITPVPGRRLIVTTHLRGADGARIDVVDAGLRRPLSDDLNIDQVRFRPPNHLLFIRVRANAGAWVAPFEAGRVDLSRAVALAPGALSLDASLEGTMIARLPARERRSLVWVSFEESRTGPSPSTSVRTSASAPGPPFEAFSPEVALSPDGRRAVIKVVTTGDQEAMVVRDLTTGVDTVVPMPPTRATGVQTGTIVSWTPRGRLLYASGGVEASQIYDWPADGSSTGRALVTGMMAKMTPDGREILFNRDERLQIRLYRAPILPDGSAGAAVPVFPDKDAPSVRWFDLSPDGRLLAYSARDSTTGRGDLFVATYPALANRQQVSSNGGTQPRFSRDGRLLFYLSGTRDPARAQTAGELRVVSIAAGSNAPIAAGISRLLMVETPGSAGGPTVSGFDVGADGRLLMTRVAPSAPGEGARLVWLQNWPAMASARR